MNTSGEPPPNGGDADKLAELRNAIRGIETAESTSGETRHSAQGDNGTTGGAHARGTYEPITYPGMPEGQDWMQRLPARYKHGERGFDRRIMEELAAVGVPCYTLGDLSNRVPTIPQGIPIFIDWLTHLEDRIPGAETPHREAIRAGLIRNLKDPAARGNPAAINALVVQMRRQPPLRSGLIGYATEALAHIATKLDFPTIIELIEELLPLGAVVGPLIEYLGKVKTDEARELALRFLDTPSTYFALRALIQMKAPGVRARVEPYLTHDNASIRKEARRAMARLPE
ncbi:HEAT repeat domain-containing protein [Mycolicibacterium smegmatis]|uniref:HEAT repeat domain-containing protein n=1 Tax=Mycolicibacterium smegmatis TaxID=1772 RepID=UPI0020A3B80D|nr:HEAT repeat domain-containing protein [Mycolicibacterium smegmatis]MCP2625622.1 HEAT repeat domain-containing protein [Mycolicibacterium smegmatis]MCP2626391.1 HEAT repeat domain-containing protein [Mycolicibacterium smegmatis]